MRDNGYAGMATKTMAAPMRGEDGPICPTVHGTINHIGGNVAQCHEWADRIEMALSGPAPGGDTCKQPCADGIESQLGMINSATNTLSARLARIAEKLGG